MTTVVKIGGGLAREAGDDALRALCRAVGEAGVRHRLLVVPGGGGPADAVRDLDERFSLRAETAHRMAILAMDAFGLLLGDLIPGAVIRTGLEPAAPGATPVLLPAALLAGDPLPASWAVTSDSIAAWVAGAAAAERLVLVKPVPGLYRDWPPADGPIARLGVDELEALQADGRAGGVDAHLPHALRAAGVPTWVVDGRDPGLLSAVLEQGHGAGTLIA